MKSSEQINELAAALVKAQAMMKPAKKSEDNPYFHSKYADLSNIMENDRKALTSNGLCVVQGAGIVGDTSSLQAVTITTRLIHTSGQWIEDSAGAIPKDFGPQAVGATLTYLRRYGYSAMVGATAEGEDDDGETAEGRSDSKREALIDRLKKISVDISEGDKEIIRKTIKTLNTAQLEPYVEKWEKKVAGVPRGAGVPDANIPFDVGTKK